MFYPKRVKALRDNLAAKKLSAALISSPANLSYLTGLVNLSRDDRDMWLLISRNKQFVITDPRFSGAVKEELPEFGLIEISVKTPFRKVLSKLVKKYNLQKIGVEESDLRVSEYKFFKKVLLKTTNFSLDELRQVKDSEELEKIKKACYITDKAFDYIAAKIKPGISERELADELEIYIKRQGAELSFDTIVAFGKNSAVPHHQTGDKKLSGSDKIILLDFGARWQGYCSDITRTVLLKNADKKLKDIYQTVLAAQQKAVDYIKDNLKSEISVSLVDALVREYLVIAGYPDLPHSLGHGVGLVIHERPHLSVKSREVLKEGMVFSIEPGIYLPKLGGVRIEDLFVIWEGRLQQLTHAPKDKPLRQATLCFLIQGDKVLLAMKKRGFGQGKWNGMGGKPLEKETIEETAKREIWEEIGVKPKLMRQVATLNFYFPAVLKDKGWNQQACVFLVEDWEGEPTESEEMEPAWFKIDELPLSQMWSDDQYWLPRVLKGEKLSADFTFDENQDLTDFQVYEEI